MPSEFFEYQADYAPTGGQDQEVVDYFTAKNITLYKTTWTFNSTRPDMDALEDTPTTNHQIEFHWIQLPLSNYLNFRHAEPFIFEDWLISHPLEVTPEYRAIAGMSEYPKGIMEKDELLALAYQSSENESYFECRCDHVFINFLVRNYNSSYEDLGASWDAGFLYVMSSYEIDFDAMKPTAFTLIAQLITFQNPDFGLPGDFGTIVNYSVGIVFWITIAIIIYTIVTRLVPTIPGGIED